MDLLGFDWVRFSPNLPGFLGNRRKSLGKRRKIGGDYLRDRPARPPGPARRQRGPGGGASAVMLEEIAERMV
jgi:hypothetical protein